MTHQLNWLGGWSLLLAAFAGGAALGLFFHRDEFWGGYGSWRRRLTRLGHVAMAALGILNVTFSISPSTSYWGGVALLAGAVAMPLVCFLSAWKKSFRAFFFIPVGLLMGAVVLILFGGVRS